MSETGKRRVFQGDLLRMLSEAEEIAATLDLDSEDWWFELQAAWSAIDKASTVVMNAMNAEVLRRQTEQPKGR